MHDEPRALLKHAIHDCLPIVQGFLNDNFLQYQVWKKAESGWRGSTEVRPNLQRALHLAEAQIKQASTAFGASLIARHPEYNGMVGFREVLSNWGKNQSQIVYNS